MQTITQWEIFNMYLLKILKAKTCGDLFTNDPARAKIEYKAMVKEIHPDICEDRRYTARQYQTEAQADLL